MQVKRLRQVFLAASDFSRQADFLAQGLGLELQFQDGSAWAQYSAGEVSVAVASADESMAAAAGSWVPVFEVDDLDGARAQVAAAGGRCLPVRDMGDHGATCLAQDPAGSAFALFRR